MEFIIIITSAVIYEAPVISGLEYDHAAAAAPTTNATTSNAHITIFVFVLERNFSAVEISRFCQLTS